MSLGVTAKQAQLMRFLQRYSRASGGVAPTVREIVAAGIIAHKSHCCRLLRGLEERGHIRRKKHCARAIEILSPVPEGTIYFRFDDATKNLIQHSEVVMN